MKASKSSGIFLDVDSGILENNLRFAANSNEEEFNRIFQPPDDQYPSKLIKPTPGFCVKTKEVGGDTKFFVNVCHTEAIPPPKDITEAELFAILDSDEPSTYRVPMSIGEIRLEKDKKGEEARVCDIAIHEKFFKKIEDNISFKRFFISVVFDGLTNKYGIVCHDEKTILKNRRAFGKLQMHRIQQREVKEKMKEEINLIEEIGKGQPRPQIETIASFENKPRVPEYRLFRKKTLPDCLMGEFKFPDILSAKDLTLDVGEDRILIESSSKNYFLDVFFPYVVKQNSCSSSFSISTKILTVTMPLVGG